MNEHESRFMRVRRYPEEHLAALHDHERAAGNNWLIAGAQKMTEIDRMLGSYWELGKPEEERAREVDAFINSHAVKKAFAKMRASVNPSEMADMHEADWYIWKNAPCPHFGKGSGDNARKLQEIYKSAEVRKTTYED